MLLSLWSASTSTYICPLVGRQSIVVALLQTLATLIDSFLAIASVELSLPFGQPSSSSRPKGPVIWTSVLVTTAAIWSAIGFVVYFAVPEVRSWLLPLDLIFSIDLVGSKVVQALLLSTLCISAYACVSLSFSLCLTLQERPNRVMIRSSIPIVKWFKRGNQTAGSGSPVQTHTIKRDGC